MTVLQTRIDEKTKKQAESIMNRLGLSLNDAVRIFINQINLTQGLPFEVKLRLNDDTMQAISDVKNDVGVKTYETVDGMFLDVLGDSNDVEN